MSNNRTANDVIMHTLTGMSGNAYTTTLDDAQLPDPIDPVVVHISEAVTSKDESDRWANTFLIYGADLLGDAITIAKETRSPRAVEVANKLLKDLFDASIKINEIRKKEDEQAEKEDKQTKDDTINLTPAQLLKMLKSQDEQT